ncbi:MAG: hypothetical protein MO847_12065 [Candidatus Protistobacter heckmanni]|nr:hypothetical protein [Candidatus Protistobacter heckmanni]
MNKTLLILGAALAAAAPLAQAQTTEYARVISATPINELVPVQRQSYTADNVLVQRPNSGAGAVLGAVAGGLLGSTAGGGAGKVAMTAAGALVGAIAGDGIESAGKAPAAVPVQRCQTAASYEQRVTAYNVVYEYAGRQFSSRLSYNPGSRVAVQIEAGTGYARPIEQDPAYAATPATVTYTSPVYTTPVYASPAVVYGPAYAPAPVYAPVVVRPYYGGWHRHWY